MRVWSVAHDTPVFPRLEERAFFLLLLAVTVLPLAACSSDAVKAAAPVRVPSSKRVVSLLPAATDVLISLGAADRVVGRTDFDTAAVVRASRSFGRTLVPATESILELDPDLVILPAFGPAKQRLADVLVRRGARVLVPQLHTLLELRELIDTLGVLLGKRVVASALNDTIEARLSRLARENAGHRPSLVYLIWHTPPTVAGRGTYLDDLMRVAGGRNAVADLRSPWPEVSLEELLRRNPDYLIVPTTAGFGAATLRGLSGWRELPAVRQRRIIEVDGDLFNRLGPQVVQAAQLLAHALRQRAVQP